MKCLVPALTSDRFSPCVFFREEGVVLVSQEDRSLLTWNRVTELLANQSSGKQRVNLVQLLVLSGCRPRSISAHRLQRIKQKSSVILPHLSNAGQFPS